MPVPDRISVVGYDDVTLATMSHPPLTTVVVPKGKAGSVAMDLLLRHVSGGAAGGPDGRRSDIVLATSLAVRASSGLAPAA